MERVVDRVVAVVFDGLRPDMVDAHMPNLAAFGRDGVRFDAARSVFPSVTRVCTTAIGTGSWPGAHGIVNNAFHWTALKGPAPFDTGSVTELRAARERAGQLVTARTLGERLASAGMRMGMIHGGSAGSAFLLNPHAARDGHWTVSAHGPEMSETPAAAGTRAPGALPAMDVPKFAPVDWAAEHAIRALRSGAGPEVLFVWFPEPDTSFHYRELGSEPTLSVIKAADAAFGRILDAVASAPERIAVLALSDHGQITTTGIVDLPALMRADGIPAAYRREEGARIAVTTGRSGEVRMLDDDPALPLRAAEWLMGRDEVGMVFARDTLVDRIPGALPLSLVHAGHGRQADIFWVLADSDEPDRWGLPGQGLFTGGVPLGGGMHGGLNRHEISTVLTIRAPDGRKGIAERAPAALPDVTPTILSLLGLPAEGADGRALPVMEAEPEQAVEEVREATSGAFRQRLVRARIGARAYPMQGGRA